MRALVFHGPEDIRCETVPDPTPPDERGAVVRIERTAICGSDLHIYHGHLSPEAGYSVGHEAIGEVVEVGSAVSRFRTGDRVLVSGVVGCGDCGPCRLGHVTACERGGAAVFGTNQGLHGAQAEALAVPSADANLYAIPDGVEDEQAVLLTDILPTGYLGAEGAEIEPGHDVAVIGCGPVGLMSILAASLFGPARIFALDSVPERLAAAEGLGAIPCDVSGDATGAIMEATGGLGPHCVIEAVGADPSIQSALALVRRGGVVSVVGVNTNLAFPFPMALAMMKGITFRIGICPVPLYWTHLVPLVAQGRLRPEFVFSHRMGLSEGTAAYDLFAGRRDGVLKVLLDPTA
ncbi:MAG: alcohol dehydrogenase catalytic domain-containing protein [Myxococcota bacterium]